MAADANWVRNRGEEDPAAIRAAMSARLAELAEMCQRLEKIADDLPEISDRENCADLARSVYETVMRAHEFEEKVAFPFLREFAGTNVQADTIERLRFEHWEDESFAAELQESLCSFANGTERTKVDTLAWMLRGFFEGVRRHVAFEREYILPLFEKASA
jgi:iron-sulfur cluster repair protein YtfE (RIC family)